MKHLIPALLLSSMTTSALAQDKDELATLQNRVQQLEERIAQLELLVTPVAPVARIAPVIPVIPIAVKTESENVIQQQRGMASERMLRDSFVYTRSELKEIERLYQIANRKWRNEEGKSSLDQLVEKFDKANRTGCALLHLGQQTGGKEKEIYLQQAIDDFSDCYYGDGVQVGAYARYHLATHFKESGQANRAEELLKELYEKFPDAIDHQGRLLSERTRNQR